MSTLPTVAFLGLGHMGLPMASNLSSAGAAVVGYDPVPAAVDAAKRVGLTMASTPGEATAGAAVVITMLPSGAHVLDAYAPGAGIVGSVPEGTLLVDCSTISVADARAAHGIGAAHGLRTVDAPVSGGVVGAEAGTLTFMAGGHDAAVRAAEPILAPLGSRVIRCGEAGMGQAAKACNNMVLAASMAAVGEAFVLAESLGLDAQVLFDVLTTSSGRCWAVEVNCPVPGPVPSSPANRGFEGGFASRLMLKDLRLALEAAEEGGVNPSIGRRALDVYEAVAESAPDHDFSVVIEHVRTRISEEGQ
jgi:3-hydroxyisobutyrate dehydrogenase